MYPDGGLGADLQAAKTSDAGVIIVEGNINAILYRPNRADLFALVAEDALVFDRYRFLDHEILDEVLEKREMIQFGMEWERCRFEVMDAETIEVISDDIDIVKCC